jgi:hypothetical protein
MRGEEVGLMIAPALESKGFILEASEKREG